MSKPIFVVRVPRRDFLGENKTFENIRLQLKEELTDYHVLLVADSDSDRSEFECYNAADATETTIQEIQDKIFEILKKNETL
jgi:hypothetical protein